MGVKLSNRFGPEVERENEPPLSEFVKLAVLIVSALALKPTKLVADAMAQE